MHWSRRTASMAMRTASPVAPQRHRLRRVADLRAGDGRSRALPARLPQSHRGACSTSTGLRDQPINVRISGCPNGCSRPYLGEIALVGKAPGRYNLMLGADHRGERLNTLYRENIDEAAILAALDPLFAQYAAGRENGEYFGDFLVSGAAWSVPAASSARPCHLELVA